MNLLRNIHLGAKLMISLKLVFINLNLIKHVCMHKLLALARFFMRYY